MKAFHDPLKLVHVILPIWIVWAVREGQPYCRHPFGIIIIVLSYTIVTFVTSVLG